jgi:hypothetical protein
MNIFWCCRGWDSIVHIVSRLQAEQLFWILAEARDFFLFAKMPRMALGSTQRAIQWVLGWSIWCVKFITRLHLVSMSSVNEWSYTSTPPICLHGVERDDFTISLFLFWCCNMVTLNYQVCGLGTRISDAAHRLEAQHRASPAGSVRHAEEHSGVCGTTSSPGWWQWGVHSALLVVRQLPQRLCSRCSTRTLTS